jgi:hypothetical protein
MEAIRVEQVVTEDGKIVITGLPYKKGQVVEVIVFAQPQEPAPCPRLTVRQLRESGIIGLWRDRSDIQDGTTYARQLRDRARICTNHFRYIRAYWCKLVDRFQVAVKSHIMQPQNLSLTSYIRREAVTIRREHV